MFLKNIEGLRFIFALVIMACHLPFLINLFPEHCELSNHFKKASLAVDFFFILSGFLFYNGVPRIKDSGFWDFFSRKFKRLAPVYLWTLLIFFLFNRFGLLSYGYEITDYIYGALFINGIGLTFNHIGPGWYVSVLIIGLLFYFMLFRLLKPMTAVFSVGLITFFGYVLLINATDGAIFLFTGVEGLFFPLGLTRGVCGIGLGILTGAAIQSVGNKFPKTGCFYWTLAEVGVLGSLLYFMVFHSPDIRNNLIFIVGFVALILLFVLKRGKLSQLMDHSVGVFLGRYSYSLFLTHFVVIFILMSSIWTVTNTLLITHIGWGIALFYLFAFLFAMLVYHVVEKPKNKLVQKWGVFKYYIGVFALTAGLISVPLYMLKQQPVPDNLIYEFKKPQLNVSVRGFEFIDQIGGFSGTNEVQVWFKKSDKPVNCVLSLLSYGPDEKEPFTLFLNGKKISHSVLMRSRVQTINIPLSHETNVDLKFKFTKPKVRVMFLQMQLLPAR